jgi:hypothetical protein
MLARAEVPGGSIFDERAGAVASEDLGPTLHGSPLLELAPESLHGWPQLRRREVLDAAVEDLLLRRAEQPCRRFVDVQIAARVVNDEQSVEGGSTDNPDEIRGGRVQEGREGDRRLLDRQVTTVKLYTDLSTVASADEPSVKRGRACFQSLPARLR